MQARQDPGAAVLGDAEKRDVAALFQAGRLAEIEERARGMMRRFPSDAFGFSILSSVLLRQGRSELALPHLLRAVALAPDEAGLHGNLGYALSELGRPDEAMASFRRALVLDPDSIPAQNGLAGACAAADRQQEAVACYQRSLAAHPDQPRTLYNLGNALLALGRLDEAVAAYRRALALWPEYAFALTNLGLALREAGETQEAEACARQALRLAPELVEARNLLASLVLETRGDTAQALALVGESLDLEERVETKRLFVACAKRLRAQAVDALLRGRLLRALLEPWARPTDLAGAVTRLVEGDVVLAGCIERALAAWPVRLPAQELFGPHGYAAVRDDPLLLGLLDAAPVCSVGLERLLTQVRHAMLADIDPLDPERDTSERTLAFYAALARQCRINEYVFDVTPAEEARAWRLQQTLAEALRDDGPVPPLWPVAVAAYGPLHAVPLAERLLARSWPEPVEAVLTQQLREHEEERLYRAIIPALTPIEDAVSRAVRRQYEENPYPRWVRAAPADAPIPLAAYLRERFPHAPLGPLPGGEGLDVLIAGCGTGQHSLETARRFRGAAVLAVDLSLTSLAYARRKTRQSGVTNIEYAQADLLRLGALGRRFDLIESSGVLHHLADPPAGWRALLPLARPGGCLRIGLYSAQARRGITRVRQRIEAMGLDASPPSIRRVRQELMDGPWDTGWGQLLLSDFFSVSGCRDLLFHVQEHCLTLLDIKGFCLENGLTVLGLDVEAPVLEDYLRRFPDDRAATNLSNWHYYEQDHPDTFIEMYQFWVQRAG